MSWFTFNRDPFHNFFKSASGGFADEDANWPFNNEYARRSPSQRQQLEQQQAAARKAAALERQRQEQLEQIRQQQEQHELAREHPFLRSHHRRYAAPPASRSSPRQPVRQEDDENYFHSNLHPFMRRMYSDSPHNSPNQQLLEQQESLEEPMHDQYREIPVHKRSKKRSTTAGAAKQRRSPKRMVPQQEAALEKHHQQLDLPQQIRNEEIPIPSRVGKGLRRHVSPHLRKSRHVPIFSADQGEESPAEKARQLHHREPAFSLRQMAEDERMDEVQHHSPQEDIVPHHMQDTHEVADNHVEGSHVPSAADRLRALMADQTAVEQEHEEHSNHELQAELPKAEESFDSEEEDQMQDDQADASVEMSTDSQLDAEEAEGPTLDDVHTISKIRELNKRAQEIKIPKLQQVSCIKDLLVPEELLTQIMLDLDNLIVSEFSRPFRKQVIQFIQKQLAHIDNEKTEYRKIAPESEGDY
eukprot:CAMPEP_0117450718 /NCGR_PEP_ID=MMETSP0759-20121206/8619_1 /TAXON_ID=63605 /ORGANISM="Percolomonas cosmopolitus, Strain WS" /LENGTH=470 /DNA_ID=CAMNT_0005243261 /DNA_START=3 /DNA_END=1415 /DNA_ORIENTATION=+